MLAALLKSDAIKYATLVNCLERFGRKHLAPVKRRELKNRIQRSGEELQDSVAGIRYLAQEAYPNMDLEFVDSATVDSFVNGIRDFEAQSLIRMHSCKNITAASDYALEVEAARRASRRSAVIHQFCRERPKIRCFWCNKEGHYQM